MAQELIKVGVMHTTSPQRAQRPDGTVPSVLDLMHQTQLQQVRLQFPIGPPPVGRGDSTATQTADRQESGLSAQHPSEPPGPATAAGSVGVPNAHYLDLSCLLPAERIVPHLHMTQVAELHAVSMSCAGSLCRG